MNKFAIVLIVLSIIATVVIAVDNNNNNNNLTNGVNSAVVEKQESDNVNSTDLTEIEEGRVRVGHHHGLYPFYGGLCKLL